MSNEILEWANIEAVDLDEIVADTSECTDTSASESHLAPLKARQKLEMYWERKRLEENLYDVLSDTGQIGTNLRNDPVGANTAI